MEQNFRGRGKGTEGYYGAKNHKKPLDYEGFEDLMNRLEPGLCDSVKISRHKAYITSWDNTHQEK